MTPSENSPSSFESRLTEQTKAAVADGTALMKNKLDTAIRWSSEWGQAAANKLSTLLNDKIGELESEIKLIRDNQINNLEGWNDAKLLERHRAIVGNILQRFRLMMEVTAVDAPKNVNDKATSTNPDLFKLRESASRLFENLDVHMLVYQTLPPSMQGSYLDALGKRFSELEPDYFAILEKISARKPLEENDWKLLSDEVKEGLQESGKPQGALAAVLGLLDAKQRYEFVEGFVVDPTFENFDSFIVMLAGTAYLTRDQALALIDAKVALLDPKSKALGLLEAARAKINSPKMEKAQKQVMEYYKKGAEKMSSTYGHFNRARGLLSFRGVGSLFVIGNGALMTGANVLSSLAGGELKDILNIPTNPLIWAGGAMVTAGLELSKGVGGTLAQPFKILGKIMKDRHEEKDDERSVNVKAFYDELGINHRFAHFYASYAERIVRFYKDQKKKAPQEDVKITLADLGIQKKEDLPEVLQSLFDNKAELEAKVSAWAARFARKSGDGMPAENAQAQVKIIQKSRTEHHLAEFELPKIE